TPCGERNIFVANEWTLASWQLFHNTLTKIWAKGSTLASQSADRTQAIEVWRIVFGEAYFPLQVA
ncbi:MAG TPA: hypothetical protein VGR97_12250, partial [Candidatus Acidoferrales bacterium]|nr:hypothetical protein [Candidatus Acidoferrales bacterium]